MSFFLLWNWELWSIQSLQFSRGKDGVCFLSLGPFRGQSPREHSYTPVLPDVGGPTSGPSKVQGREETRAKPVSLLVSSPPPQAQPKMGLCLCMGRWVSCLKVFSVPWSCTALADCPPYWTENSKSGEEGRWVLNSIDCSLFQVFFFLIYSF